MTEGSNTLFKDQLDGQMAKGQQLATISVRSDEELSSLDAKSRTWHEYSRDLVRTHYPEEEIGDFSPGVFSSHATLDTRVEGLRRAIRSTIQKLESIRERLPLLDQRKGRPLPGQDDWIPTRLLKYIAGSLHYARKTGTAADWGKVTRDAILFLEDELRHRHPDLLDVRGRHDLAGRALNPNSGVFTLNKTNDVQQGWMNYVQGMFAIFGNPAAHTIRSHSDGYATGVVGAVSAVLVMLDEEIGQPRP